MSDLNAKIVADLKAQLAAAQEEANQQRTRAEAAEQELRELNIRIGKHPATAAWAKSGIGALEVGMAAEAKLAAIRAHLAGVDVVALAELVEMATRAPWKAVHNFTGQDWGVAELGSDDDGRPWTVSTDSIRCSEMDRGGASEDAKAIASLRNAAEALLAAAREALEP